MKVMIRGRKSICRLRALYGRWQFDDRIMHLHVGNEEFEQHAPAQFHKYEEPDEQQDHFRAAGSVKRLAGQFLFVLIYKINDFVFLQNPRGERPDKQGENKGPAIIKYNEHFCAEKCFESEEFYHVCVPVF